MIPNKFLNTHDTGIQSSKLYSTTKHALSAIPFSIRTHTHPHKHSPTPTDAVALINRTDTSMDYINTPLKAIRPTH